MRATPSPADPSPTGPVAPKAVEVPHVGEAARLLQALEALDARDEQHHPLPIGPTRWLLPYADVMTLLFALFLVLYIGGRMEMAPLQQRYEGLTKQVAQLQTQLASKQQTVTRLENNLGSLRQQLNQWQTQTEQKAGVHLRESGQDLVVTLDEQIVFAPGQAVISPKAQGTLAQLAQLLKRQPHPIRIEGHTDNTPIHTAQFPSNWELSTARAMAILRVLAEKHHLPAQQLAAAGYGQFRPVADNSTVQGKQKNRRVDIVIMGQSLPQPTPSPVVASPVDPSPHGQTR